MKATLVDVLPKKHRIRTATQYSSTKRSGARYGSRNVVVSISPTTAQNQHDSRVGFITSKAVGNAVTRNKVKRRLRAIAARDILKNEKFAGWDVVISARPPAANESYQRLREELLNNLERAKAKYLRRNSTDHISELGKSS